MPVVSPARAVASWRSISPLPVQKTFGFPEIHSTGAAVVLITTEHSVMGHCDGTPQGMLSAVLAHRRVLLTCLLLKDEVLPTPVCSYRHGERNGGMPDSLAGEARALRAILLAVCRAALGPFARADSHANLLPRGDHHPRPQRYAPVCAHIPCKTGASSSQEPAWQTVMVPPLEDQGPPAQPAQCVQGPPIRPRRYPGGHVLDLLTSSSLPGYVHVRPRQRAPSRPSRPPSP